MESTPRRRWFRFAFSLRTLFIVVTVSACAFGWLVWQMQIVRERNAIIAELDPVSHDDRGRELPYPHRLGILNSDPKYGDPRNFEYVSVSKVRELLGDQGYTHIWLSAGVSRELAERIERAFPEAELRTEMGQFRDSLSKPVANRRPNKGTIFKTGLIEK